MDELYWKFTSEIDADNAINKIWYNEVINAASNEERLVGDGNLHYYLSELQTMTEEQVTTFKIYGKKNGIIEYNEQGTIKFTEKHECYNEPGSYVIKKPPIAISNGVTNYTEQAIDLNWWPPYNGPGEIT